MQIPPAAATGLAYKVAKINDSFTRYDVKVSWDWVRGTGAPIREFIVYYTIYIIYNNFRWPKAIVSGIRENRNEGTANKCQEKIGSLTRLSRTNAHYPPKKSASFSLFSLLFCNLRNVLFLI